MNYVHDGVWKGFVFEIQFVKLPLPDFFRFRFLHPKAAEVVIIHYCCCAPFVVNVPVAWRYYMHAIHLVLKLCDLALLLYAFIVISSHPSEQVVPLGRYVESLPYVCL